MTLRTLALAAAATLALASQAGAVTGGSPDGDGHPNVGLLLAGSPDGPTPVCSAVLVAPSVVLTAGHCTAGLGGEAWVSFAPAFDPAAPAHRGVPVTHERFGHDMGDLYDLGVLLLDEPVEGIVPAELPARGLLDRVSSASYTSVGYGVTSVRPWAWDGVRRVAETPFAALTRSWLKLHSASGSGVCFGDSGGPQFLPGTAVVVSLTSGGNPECTGTSSSYRLDTAAALEFVGRFR